MLKVIALYVSAVKASFVANVYILCCECLHSLLQLFTFFVSLPHRMTDRKHDRFKNAFSAPPVRLLTIRDVAFVLVNSMAMEGDGCNICREAEEKLKEIKWQLKCSKVGDRV